MNSIELNNEELYYVRELINNRIKDVKIRLKLYSRIRHQHNRHADERDLDMLKGLQQKVGPGLQRTEEEQMS